MTTTWNILDCFVFVGPVRAFRVHSGVESCLPGACGSSSDFFSRSGVPFSVKLFLIVFFLHWLTVSNFTVILEGMEGYQGEPNKEIG